MSRFHASLTAADARNHASAADIAACFRDQRNLLDKLAFLVLQTDNRGTGSRPGL